MNRECQKTEKRIGPYLDGELADRRRRRLEVHLESCPACRRELELHRAVSRGSRAAAGEIRRSLEPKTIWPQLRIELKRSSIPAAARKKPAGLIRRWSPVWAGAGLAAAAALFLIIFLPMFKKPTATWSAVSTLNAPNHSVLIYQNSEIVFIWLTEES